MLARRPAITIITPTFNRRAAVERAIGSVQQQSLADYEHIVVDDCSTDDTTAYLDSLRDSRIRHIRFAEWQGANRARNAGIDLARSEWVTFLDSDDEFLPERLAATLHAAHRRAAWPLLLSSFTTLKRGALRPAINPEISLTGPELEQALMHYVVFIAGSSITVRRKSLLSAGAFAPQIQRMQDREALLRLAGHTGAQLLATADWIKHPSADSISLPRGGYLQALAVLLEARPDLACRYRVAVGYHLARHLLADLSRGRLGLVRDALRANSHFSPFGFELRELWRSYFRGAAERRALKRALFERQEKPTLLPFVRPIAPAEQMPRSRAA